MIALLWLSFVVGLALSAALPGMGLYLRLRNEWLATLALAQFVALGTLLAGVMGLPLVLGAIVLVVIVMGVKYLCADYGPSFYALLMVVGWSGSLLLVAKAPAAQELAHALTDGQLYLIGKTQGGLTIVLTVVVAMILPRLSRALLRGQLFPSQFATRERWRYLAFDVLVGVTVVMATLSLGFMSTFALAFFPSWLAWVYCSSWKQAVIVAPLIGVIVYVGVFILAWAFDLPFGPACAFCLAIVSLPTLGKKRGSVI